MKTITGNGRNRRIRNWRIGMALAIVLCLALGGTAVEAQSKNAAKQTESLAKSAENAKKQIGAAVDQLSKMLAGYNEIIDGKAKNPQSAYKKLAGDLKNTEKTIQGAGKSADAMNKEAKKFFAAWEKDLEEITDEGLKQKSQGRLDASKEKYGALGEGLAQAGEAFAPLIKNLNEQVLFLGRDLSPEAIADLEDEAAGLNQQAEQVTDQVNSIVSSAGESQ